MGILHNVTKAWLGFVVLALSAGADAKSDLTFWESPLNNKLNSIEVSEIAQDGSGALWFATQEGLTRQRGDSVEIFTAANASNGGLQKGEVKDLAVSSRGHLWVLTRSIQVFDPESQRFKSPLRLAHDLNPNSIAFDSFGRLWIGFEDSVAIYKPGFQQLEFIQVPESNLSVYGGKLRASPMVKLLPYDDSMIGISSEGIFEFRIETNDKPQARSLITLSSADSTIVVSTAALLEDSLFVGTIYDGLIVLNLNDNSVTRINEGPENDDLPSDLITAALSDSSGVWLGTQNGLVFTDDGGRTFQYFGDSFTGLPSSWIVGLFKSSDGSYWVGTREGLAQGVKTQFDAFNATNSNLSHNHVNSVHQDDSGTIWVGTQNGLNRLKPGETNFSWLNSTTEPILGNSNWRERLISSVPSP